MKGYFDYQQVLVKIPIQTFLLLNRNGHLKPLPKSDLAFSTSKTLSIILIYSVVASLFLNLSLSLTFKKSMALATDELSVSRQFHIIFFL